MKARGEKDPGWIVLVVVLVLVIAFFRACFEDEDEDENGQTLTAFDVEIKGPDAAKQKGGAWFDPDPAVKSQALLVATATAAAATAAAAVFTTTAAASRTLFAGLGNIDREGATAQLRAVQRRNGLLRLFG